MGYLNSFIISVITSVSTISILGFVVYISRSWVLERLKASIKHEYDLKMLEVEKQKALQQNLWVDSGSGSLPTV